MAASEKMATGPRAHEPAEPWTGEMSVHMVGAWLVTTSHQTSLQAEQEAEEPGVRQVLRLGQTLQRTASLGY